MDPELHKAAISGDVGFLSRLDKDDPRLMIFLDCTPVGAETPLHVALLHGRLKFATDILKLSPELARMPDERGSYPLHLSSARGYEDVVKELLNIDPMLSCLKNEEGRTALALAALNEKGEVLKLLYGVYKRQVEFLKALGYEEEWQEEPILHFCVERNLFEMAKLLVELDKELVKKSDVNGNTPLHYAATKPTHEMFGFLLQKMEQKDVLKENYNGFNAIHISFYNTNWPRF